MFRARASSVAASTASGRVGAVLLIAGVAVTLLLCAFVFVDTTPETVRVVDHRGRTSLATTSSRRRGSSSSAHVPTTTATPVAVSTVTAAGREAERPTTLRPVVGPGQQEGPASRSQPSAAPADAEHDAAARWRPAEASSSPAEESVLAGVKGSRSFWRDEEGQRFGAIAAYRGVCVTGSQTLVPINGRASWEPAPPAVSESTQLLVNDDGRPVTSASLSSQQRARWYRGTTLMARRPHGRNIAHAFVEAMWLGMHVLRVAAESSSFKHRLPDDFVPTDGSSGVQRVLHTPFESYGDGLSAAVNASSWQVGAMAAVAAAAGVHEFLPNPSVNGAAKGLPVACFERLIAVGSSRDMCVDVQCRRDGYGPRDRTKYFVRDAVRKAAGLVGEPATPSSPLRVGMYFREDQNATKFNRRIRKGGQLMRCVGGLLQALLTQQQGGTTAASSSEPDAPSGDGISSDDGRSAATMVLSGVDLGDGKSRDVELVLVPWIPRRFGAQVALFGSFDVLVAASGAANTNALWMAGERTGVVSLSGCSQGYLSWLSTTRLPDQDVVLFKLCSKRGAGVVFEKPADGGVVIPCATVANLRGGRLKVTVPEAILRLLRRRVAIPV